MEQVMQETITKKPKRVTTVLLNFRVTPEDGASLKEEAARRRTNVSSVVRGALLQAGVLKSNRPDDESSKEGVEVKDAV